MQACQGGTPAYAQFELTHGGSIRQAWRQYRLGHSPAGCVLLQSTFLLPVMSDLQFTGCFTQHPELPTAAHRCPCRHIASGLAAPLCLQASLSGLLALTAGCNQQYLQWQIYPASGASAYVNHTVTGLCLYPGSELTLWRSCPGALHPS